MRLIRNLAIAIVIFSVLMTFFATYLNDLGADYDKTGGNLSVFNQSNDVLENTRQIRNRSLSVDAEGFSWGNMISLTSQMGSYFLAIPSTVLATVNDAIYVLRLPQQVIYLFWGITLIAVVFSIVALIRGVSI